MSETIQVAILILVAVLIGALLPVLFQFRSTLKQMQLFLESTGVRLERTLDETAGAMVRIQNIAAQMEQSSASIASALDTAQRTLRVVAAIGAAIGPAVAAAVQAFHARRDGSTQDADGRDDMPGSGVTGGVSSGEGTSD
jgi:hypothetical protein